MNESNSAARQGVASRHRASLPSTAVLCLLCTLPIACDESSGEPSSADAAVVDDARGSCTDTRIAECLSYQQVCEVDGDQASCRTCDMGEYTSDGRSCEAIVGDTFEHTFESGTFAPGEENSALCQSWTLDNDEALWLNAVEISTVGGLHHSNWYAVPKDQFDGPDGHWPCEDRNYDDSRAGVIGVPIFAQSTQAHREVQKFPGGAAVRIEPHARIVGGTHVLNVSDETIATQLTMRLTMLPADRVDTPLTIFHLVYRPIRLPAHATSLVTGDCAFSSIQDEPFDASIYYVLPHYHGLGTGFHLEMLGGEHDGEEFFRIEGFSAEPRGRTFDPPISLAGAEGLRFGCEYMNPRDEDVGWGVGDQEMCEMLGFIRSDYYYEGKVLEESSAEVNDGVRHYSGECEMIALPATERNGIAADGGVPTFDECIASGPEGASEDCMQCVCERGPAETVECDLPCWTLVDCVGMNCVRGDLACITEHCGDLLGAATAATVFDPIITQCADRCRN